MKSAAMKVGATHAFVNPAVRQAAIVKLSAARQAVNPVRSVSCSTCALKGACLPCGLDRDKLDDMDDLTRVKRRVAKGATLYRSGDGFEWLYAVRSGAFKSVGLSRGGEEKVTGVHLPGDVMGLEGINTLTHGFDAVALEDSEVCTIPYARLAELAARMPQLQAQLFRILSGDISRDQGLMLLMGGMDAEQRIAAFLLSLSHRYKKLGYSTTRFALRMTREEIGSYLGLTLETVSRVFSRLQRGGVLTVHAREVELTNVERLHDIVGH